MSTTTRYGGLSNTTKGRNKQINRGYRGMADEMKRKQVPDLDCDEPQTVEGWRRLVANLRNQLADAQTLIDDMRAQVNTDQVIQPGNKVNMWSTARVAEASGKSIATICRNAKELKGIKQGPDWWFPAGTVYKGGRKPKK